MRTLSTLLVILVGLSWGLQADDHGDSPLSATPVAVGGDLIGACTDPAGDMDYFLFQALGGRTYLLLTSHLSTGMDTVLYLFDSDGGTILVVDDDSGDQGGSRIEWPAPRSGTYFAMVRHAQATAGTGCYDLSIGVLQVDDHGNDPLSATPLPIGERALDGFLETASDLDVFLFAVEAGYDYKVDISKTSGTGDIVLRLFGENGIDELARTSTDGQDGSIRWSPERDGTLFATVSREGGNGDGDAGYEIHASRPGYSDDHGNSASSASDVSASGDAVEGRIEVAGDRDWFRFAVRRAGEYTIAVDAVNGGIFRAALVGLDGETVLEEAAAFAGEEVRLTWVAPSDGAYFIEISLGSGTGSYVLSLDATLQLELLGQFNPQGYSLDLAAEDDLVYLIVGTKGLLVVDATDPTRPTEIGSNSTRGYAQAVAVRDTTVYIANRGDGLTILDASDPMRPVEIASLETLGSAQAVALHGNTAYVADQRGGMQIIDVATPANPKALGTYETLGFAQAVWIDGNIAYVALGDAGLEMVDVSSPGAPQRLGFVELVGDAGDVVVSNGIAYIAAGYRGVRIVDVSDPASPQELSFLSTAGEAMGVTLVGNRLYVAERTEGLSVFSVADPRAPVQVAHVDTPGEAMQVAVSGDLAYVADRESGMQIVRLLP